MSAQDLTIGAVAKQAGVNVETIRYYQRRRLLAVPRQPAGGVRRYAVDTVQRVRFIKRAQQLGFTLEEIAALLQLNDGRHCEETRAVAAQKLAQLERKIADLDAMRSSLAQLIRACARPDAGPRCPIIDALAD
jgi:MerR family transcriptional regulator, mercuric resistance operon regulatory protein